MTTEATLTDLCAAFFGDDEPPPGYVCESSAVALESLARVAAAGRCAVESYRAGYYSRFVPGKLARIDGRGWAALCDVTMDGRLATVIAYATWEAR